MTTALVIGHDHVAGIEHVGEDLERRWPTLPGMPSAGLDVGALEAATAHHVDRSAPASRSLLDLVR